MNASEKNELEPDAGATEGLTINVNNLSYGVYLGGGRQFKKILHEVSFHLRPGALCALMGPSGSGKSTLLDLLADRTLVGEWSGDILFNGGPRSRWFSRDSAYILQDDLHVATLTVREAVYFAASCKLPEGTSKDAINKRVQELLEITGLNIVQDSIIGDPSRKGISGGQLKRLSIAVEIVSLPKTIFLDEPTSGLDSTIALEVMAAIKRIANQKRTCISTIHQPSTAVYEMFDTIVLLSHGHLIYFGPANRVVSYFTAPPYAYYYIPGQNPAEFILEVSEGVITPVDAANVMTRVVPTLEQFVRKFHESSFYTAPTIPTTTANQTNSDSKVQSVGQNGLLAGKRQGRLHATTKWTQFKMLLWRDGLAIVRDIDAFYAVLAKSIIVGLLIGIVFFKQGETTLPLFDEYGVPYAEVTNISALLFFGMMHSMITNIEAIPHICSKNLIFRREVNSFAYSVSPYWLTAMISHLPLQIFGYVIFVSITFFLCDFKRTFDYFIYYAVGVFLANICSYNVALLLGATVRREGTALVAYPLIFLFFSTFSGYPILIPNVPKFWSWAPTINFVRWCYQGLMINQWDSYDHVANANGSVLALYDFENWNKYASFGILLAMFGLTSFFAYFAMRSPSRKLLWFADAEELGKKYARNGDQEGLRVYRFSSFFENSFGLLSASEFIGSGGPKGQGSNVPSTDHVYTQDGVLSERFSASNPLLITMFSKQEQPPASSSSVTEALLDAASSSDAHEDVERGSATRSSLSSYRPPSVSLQVQSTTVAISTGPERTFSIPDSRLSNQMDATISTTSPMAMKAPPITSLREHSRRLIHKKDDIGFTLTFDNLCYEVQIPIMSAPIEATSKETATTTAKTQTLPILRGVSGYAKPGEICALMGSSGAGKTTLLDILACRKTIGHLSGTICINNSPVVSYTSTQLLKQVTAYVMQENVLIGALTVREHLYYAARLRLSYKDFHGEVGIQQRVDDLLTMLGLTHVQHSRVGYEGDRGISGGQKKRVSIGVEIIHFPEIIFLDEPTTGLDSAISYEVMSAVRSLADQQRTVVCTIHQPSPATYALFNTLLLLSAGRVLYFGKADEAVSYFQFGSQEYSFPYLTGSNPAEYVIAVASGAIVPLVSENRQTHKETNVSTDAIADFYMTTGYADQLNEVLHPLPTAVGGSLVSSPTMPPIGHWETIAKKNHVNSVFVQVPVLMGRMFLVKRREYHMLTLSLAKSVIIGVFYGTIFFHLPTNNEPSTYINRIAIAFFSLISLIMAHQSDIPDILEQRLLFNRERSSQTISTEGYWLAKFFLDAPMNALFVLIYSIIIYHLCFLRSASGSDSSYFWYFYYIMWVTDIIAYFAAQLVANVSPSSEVAMSLFPILMFFALAFEGFIIYVPEFPFWSQWATYVSYLRYSFQALVLNEFEDNPELPLSPLYLNELGFDSISKRDCAGYLWIFVGMHAVMAFFALKYVNFIKR